MAEDDTNKPPKKFILFIFDYLNKYLYFDDDTTIKILLILFVCVLCIIFIIGLIKCLMKKNLKIKFEISDKLQSKQITNILISNQSEVKELCEKIQNNINNGKHTKDLLNELLIKLNYKIPPILPKRKK